MKLSDHIPEDPEACIWDIVVIGTGAGGATAGFKLARIGRSVLFIERGNLTDHSDPALNSNPLTETPGTVNSDNCAYGESQSATQPALIAGNIIGGATIVFGMVLDRFRPIDFTPHAYGQIPTSSSIPNTWPIQYEHLEPYYREAEALFRVRGTEDPLTLTGGVLLSPPPPSVAELEVFDTLTQSGLHPYRLHHARECIPGCDGCPGVPCPKNCRNDASRICIRPALEQYRARILPDCLVLKLESNRRQVEHVLCYRDGRYLTIRGRTFILALNALFTPALLLRSANDFSPNGLGNQSGMVGRNLMTHVSDLLTVTFPSINGFINSQFAHGLSLNDFYTRDGFKLGNIHAHALDFPQFAGNRMPNRISAGTAVFSTIVEDFPYVDNRVSIANGSECNIVWQYTYPAELRSRSRLLIHSLSSILPSTCDVTPWQPANMLNPSHTCGTCRFGDDPRTSVLDRNNKIHDLDNAYVLDGSFFPSSGGINPALTIMANSLRVSSLIGGQ